MTTKNTPANTDCLSLIQNSTQAAVVTDTTGQLTFFNSAFALLLNDEDHSFLQQPIQKLLTTESENSLFLSHNYSKSKGNKKSFEGEITIKNVHGALLFCTIKSHLITLKGKNHYLIFIEDNSRYNALQTTVNSLTSAIDTGWASIEFNPNGTIISANDNFLHAIEYTAEELKEQHHRIFCEPAYAASIEYTQFWNNLSQGLIQTGEFKRLTKSGREIWIQASYTPIKNAQGQVFKVIKIAVDITNMVEARLQADAVKNAVDTGWASIEFEPDGTIITANDNFCHALEYNLAEIQHQHHRLFCEAAHANSSEYAQFWQNLSHGSVQAGEFKRLTKSGKEIWIQASYTPVRNQNGQVYKIIKIAADITEMVNNRNQTDNLSSQLSNAVSEINTGNFEFTMDKTGFENAPEMVHVIENIEALRDNLIEIIGAVNNVVIEAGENGNLNARIHLGEKDGSWRNMVDALNMLLNSVSEPMLEFNSIITEMANGNLTQKFELNAKGDILTMANSLNQAIENLNTLLISIDSSANVIANSSSEMLNQADFMKNNTSEVASAISQMAKGAQDQAAKTDESSKLVELVLQSANTMEDKSNIINKTAESGKNSCENGLKIVKDLVENMEEIQLSANNTSGSITILTQRAEEIARTLNVITDIAAQTNLLALNAAIEAARAGEAGRGFAVVAEEIRKLAEDSRQSAVDIEKIIGDVQKDTSAASKAIETMENNVKQGNKASKDAESIFEEINKASDETFTYSLEIQNSTVEQKESINRVVKNIEQIVVVAEETAAGSQQVASSAQELNNGMNEVTDASSNLSQIAAELQAGVSQFKLANTYQQAPQNYHKPTSKNSISFSQEQPAFKQKKMVMDPSLKVFSPSNGNGNGNGH